MKNKTRNIWFFFIVIIFLLGLWRSFFIVMHDPLYGLANSYDMLRLQACHNIMPSNKIYLDGRGTPEAPLAEYKQVKKRVGECFFSSESFFIYSGMSFVKIRKLFSSEGNFDIRIFGSVRILFLFSFSLIISYILYKNKYFVASAVNALIFALILCDPGVTIYANTFYTEFSSVFGLYLSLGFFYLFILFKNKTLLFITAFGFLMLGFSKPQHMLLPLLIAILFISISYFKKVNLRENIFYYIFILLVAFFILGGQLYLRSFDINSSIKNANAINTFLATFSPRAQNQVEFLSHVGLPEKCHVAVGDNFISIQRFAENPCPEVVDASRLKLSTYFFKDPQMFLLVAKDGLSGMRPWLTNLYGHVEGKNNQHINNVVITSDNFINFLSIKAFYFFLGIPFLIIFVFAFSKKLKAIKLEDLFILIALLFITIEIFSISILGDGLGDFGKHNHLTIVILLSIYLIFIVNLFCRIFFYKK